MKLTKSQLKQIIKEEYDSSIEEYGIDRFGPAAKGHREAAEVEKNPTEYMTTTFENAEQLKAYIQNEMTGVEFLIEMGMVSGMSLSGATERTHEILGHLRMGEEKYRLISVYSGGMRQKIKLAHG